MRLLIYELAWDTIYLPTYQPIYRAVRRVHLPGLASSLAIRLLICASTRMSLLSMNTRKNKKEAWLQYIKPEYALLLHVGRCASVGECFIAVHEARARVTISEIPHPVVHVFCRLWQLRCTREP
jgi:hypothetical protein